MQELVPWGIYERGNSHKNKLIHWEIELLNCFAVELVIFTELTLRKVIFREPKDSFSLLTEPQVDFLELLFPMVINWNSLAIYRNMGAESPDSFWRALATIYN